MNDQFKQALTLLRDLADMQNGAPLLRYEKEYNELMQQVYDFLNEHEEPIGKPTEKDIKYQLIKACPEGFDMKLWLQLHNCKDGVISEPLDCKKIQWSGKDGELTSLVAKIAKQHQSQGRKGSILPIGFIQRKKDERHPLFEDVPETTIPQGMHPKTWEFLNKHKN